MADEVDAPAGADAQSQSSHVNSQTAEDYINQQLQLEADAKEALPYQFDTCTKALGPLRQSLFSCLTCSPPPASPDAPYDPAGVCYSCSISCHGEHELVELFSKRDFECDCGTTRIPTSACSLRSNPNTGVKGGVVGEEARSTNKYNHNFRGRFCACGDLYDPAKEKGTMFQCLGLGHVDGGGCGEDWWHPECLLGLLRKNDDRSTESHDVKKEQEASSNGQVETPETDQTAAPHQEGPLPAGFPDEDEFDHVICYKCVEAQPWIKPYAGTTGFLWAPALPDHPNESSNGTAKRKREDDEEEPENKRGRLGDSATSIGALLEHSTARQAATETGADPKHTSLSTAAKGRYSIFVKDDFRDHFCRCPECFPRLSKFPQLLEEEEAYEPPVSESDQEDDPGGSVGSRSLLDRGEAALSTMDRMKAIEGVMAYNHLRDKVKTFLQPFADSGQAVGAEDVKSYFAKLRGDEDAMRQAAASADGSGGGSDKRHEQSGY